MSNTHKIVLDVPKGITAWFYIIYTKLDLKPSELAPEWADLSYYDNDSAKLYCNGEDVHIWKIHKVSI